VQREEIRAASFITAPLLSARLTDIFYQSYQSRAETIASRNTNKAGSDKKTCNKIRK
jgi:hypothetical protein